MKLCIWTTKLFEHGGTKRVITLLANEWKKEHDVTIMCYDNRFYENRSMYNLNEDIKVYFIEKSDFRDLRRTPSWFWQKVVKKTNNKIGFFNREAYNDVLAEAVFPKEARKKWVEYLNKQNYDVIIATASLALRLAMIAPELNAKTIGWQHNCYDGYINTPGVVFWKQENLLREYLPRLDRYVVLSEYDQRDYLEKLGIETEVKTNPRSFVSEVKCNPDTKQFLVAARFVYAKGLDLLMESFETFCRRDDEWKLVILGDGALFKTMQEDALRRGIGERVDFVGYTNSPQEYYLNSSIFLLPSRWEGWPMVIMEAFEFGLPVIAYHTGAMDLIIDDGRTGLLLPAFDTAAYSEAMLQLAYNSELRHKMSENAIEKSADFAIEKVVKEWDDLFQKLLR